MKRTVGLFLIICMVFLLSACAENMNSQEAETGSSVSQTAAEAAENEMSDSENSEEPDNTADDVKAKLLYMGQASIRITTIEGKVIYIDPYVGDGYEPAAGLVLVTHSHYDHNGVDKVANHNPDCRIITWKEALENGEHQTFGFGFRACLHDRKADQPAAGNEGGGHHMEGAQGEDQYHQPRRYCYPSCL